MTRRDPASRDHFRARAALPREQREVWGAPVRDGTCADDSDECEACRCAPPPPAAPLIAGGQGRSDEATMSSGELASWIFVLGVSAAALFLVARWWGWA